MYRLMKYCYGRIIVLNQYLVFKWYCLVSYVWALFDHPSEWEFRFGFWFLSTTLFCIVWTFWTRGDAYNDYVGPGRCITKVEYLWRKNKGKGKFLSECSENLVSGSTTLCSKTVTKHLGLYSTWKRSLEWRQQVCVFSDKNNVTTMC